MLLAVILSVVYHRRTVLTTAKYIPPGKRRSAIQRRKMSALSSVDKFTVFIKDEKMRFAEEGSCSRFNDEIAY